jgi:lipid-binding SYLF domain-containing protein
MKMGTAGLNIGLGAQKYTVIFFFENKTVFDKFIDKGWEADANANAVAGNKGTNAEAQFRNGIAIYQITKGGLMLQADIAGTKYWKHKKLNR